MITRTAISGFSTTVQLDALDADLRATLTAGGYAQAVLYNASQTEDLIISGVPSGTIVDLERDVWLTWPVGAGLRVVRLVATPLPVDVTGAALQALEGVTAGPGIIVTTPAPGTKVVAMKSTSVTPGDYGGALVDRFGRFTYIPTNWPASAMPLWSPNGTTTPTSAATSALNVSYARQVGSTLITGNSVQTAIVQLEDAILNLPTLSPGVMSVTTAADSGITIGGTSANLRLSLTDTGVTPGTYAGLTVDVDGRIIGASATSAVTITYQSPFVQTPIVGTPNAVSMTLAMATGQRPGIVQLADPSDVIGAAPTAAPTDVLSFESGRDLVDDRIKRQQATDLSDAATIARTDYVELTSSVTQIRSRATVADLDAGLTVAASFSPPSTVLKLNGVSGIILISTGVYQVTLVTPQRNANFHVSVSCSGTRPFLHTVTPVSTIAFEIRFFDVSGTTDTSAAANGANPVLITYSPVNPLTFSFSVEVT